VSLSRQGQEWLSGQCEGIILQCKETAVVRPLSTRSCSHFLLQPSAAAVDASVTGGAGVRGGGVDADLCDPQSL